MNAPEPKFFEVYTRLVPETDLVAAMQAQLDSDIANLASISEQNAEVLHAPYTWTIKQVVGHMIDTEIVFAYRALRFARGDQTPLPGFDQDLFIATGNDNERKLRDLVEQFELTRRANIAMFCSLPPAAWLRAGTASELTWTVEDLARAIIGHVRHHGRIVEKRLASVG